MFRCLLGTKTNLHAHNNTIGDGLVVTKVQLFSEDINIFIKVKLPFMLETLSLSLALSLSLSLSLSVSVCDHLFFF
jgi:hypothetical protein